MPARKVTLTGKSGQQMTALSTRSRGNRGRGCGEGWGRKGQRGSGKAREKNKQSLAGFPFVFIQLVSRNQLKYTQAPTRLVFVLLCDLDHIDRAETESLYVKEVKKKKKAEAGLLMVKGR